MSAQKLTHWYPGTVKPARVGVYERKNTRTGQFSYWTGDFWSTGFNRGEQATRHIKSIEQRTPWRGVSK